MLVVKDSQDVKKNEAISILKIGYSKDDRGEGRFQDYINSGLVIYPIKTIPGGSLRLEGELQKKYRHLSIPGRSREWFYMSDEILDDFSKCSSETDLYQLIGVDNEDELIKREESLNSDKKRLILNIQALMNQFKQDHPDKLDSDTYRLLEEFENLSAFSDRMRLVCNNSGDSLLLQYIPDPFITYFNILGSKRCQSLNYKGNLLKERYDQLLLERSVTQSISDKLLMVVEIGKKYPLKIIKELIRNVYKDFGITRTPKATDIENFLNARQLQSSQFVNGKKKSLRVYEILGKND